MKNFTLLLLLLLLSSCIAAQVSLDSYLKKYDFLQASAVRINAPEVIDRRSSASRRDGNSNHPFPSKLNIGFDALDKHFELRLSVNRDLWSRTSTAKVLGANGAVTNVPVPMIAYAGKVHGGSWARANMIRMDDTGTVFTAMMKIDDNIIVVEQATKFAVAREMQCADTYCRMVREVRPTAEMIVYNINDIKEEFQQGIKCGVVDDVNGELSRRAQSLKLQVERANSRHLTSLPSRRLISMGVVADYAYYQNYGTVEDTVEKILSVWNIVGGLFRDEINLDVRINELVIMDSPDTSDDKDWNQCINIFMKLSEFSEWRHKYGGNDRLLWHLMAGCVGDSDPYVGLAYMFSFCDPLKMFSIALSMDLNTDVLDWMLVAHEIGHNLGATHEPQGNGLMSPIITESNPWEFSMFSRMEMVTFLRGLAMIREECLPYACSPYEYSNEEGECVWCGSAIPMCDECNGAVECVSCARGFFLEDHDSCTDCHDAMVNCALCNSESECTRCDAGTYFDEEHNCVSCYYAIDGCALCYGDYEATYCSQCMAGFYMVDDQTCERCENAVQYCNLCTGPDECYSCEAGSFLQGSTECVPCEDVIPNCALCTDGDNCVACKPDTMLVGPTECVEVVPI